MPGSFLFAENQLFLLLLSLVLRGCVLLCNRWTVHLVRMNEIDLGYKALTKTRCQNTQSNVKNTNKVRPYKCHP